MSIAQSILANPGKYSIEQLKRGVETGTIPAYIAVPLIQQKVQEAQRAKMASAAAGAPQQGAPTVTQEVMAQAAPEAGVTALPSGLPAQGFEGGGIVAFEEGGEVERYQNAGLVASQPAMTAEEIARLYRVDPESVKRVVSDMRRALRTRQVGAAAAPLVGSVLVPEVVLGGGLTASMAATDVMDQMSPEDRKKFYRNPMVGAMSPDSALAGAILNAPGMEPSTSGYFDQMGKLLGTAGKTLISAPGYGLSALFNQPSAPVTPAAAKAEPKKEEAAAAPVAPPAPPAAAAPRDNAGIYSLMPTKGQFSAPPQTRSMEDVVRQQLYGSEMDQGFLARSEARTRNLFEELGKNKLEGKAFEGLEADIKKEAEEAGLERSQAKNLAILKAGLSSMAGTSRHALENLGRGILTGVEDYSTAVKDLKKAEKERQKQMAFIEQARRAEDQENFKRRDALLEKANAAAEANDKYGTSAIMNAVGVDQNRGLEIWKTQFGGEKALQAAGIQAGATLGAAQLRNAALANRGMEISPYQMARLRGDAEKVVDMDAVRAEMAKSLKLANPPKPGVDKSFDAKVDALYNTKLSEVVARRLGMLPNAAGVNPNIYAGYSIVRDND